MEVGCMDIKNSSQQTSGQPTVTMRRILVWTDKNNMYLECTSLSCPTSPWVNSKRVKL